ncbi:hypothetical protein ACJMK2_010095 [Sinanodonta woodiana]|uniref:ubiquitinyl hydrolase 1 n=2 Tax=Sinanodonta woodiana TaxID=1069815 RepID=A0ABD3VH88_SINWO
MSSDNGSYAILLETIYGRKKEKGLLKTGVSNVEVLKGVLLRIRSDISVSRPAYNQVLVSLDHEGAVEIETKEKIYELITVEELKLLQPIPNCNERLTVYQDKEWLRDGMSLKVGDAVTVWVKSHPDPIVGKLRYKGEIPDFKGTYFGVELLDAPGLGTCDGTFRKKTYFTCAPDSAVFVGLHKLRRCEDASYRSHISEGMMDMQGASANMPFNCRLRIGDRVVWMSDNGPEGGVVQWVGVLPDAHHSHDVTIGVEFDNPVGSGTGKYKNQRLFHAKQGHASLVPLLGLIKEDEFYTSSALGDNILQDLDVLHSEGPYGKTQEEVIEEQKRLLEQAQRQSKVSTIPIETIEMLPQHLLKDQADKQKYYEDTSRNEYKLNPLSSNSNYTSSGILQNVHIQQSTIPPPQSHGIRGQDKYRGEEIGSEGGEIVNPLYEYHNKRELKGELEPELTSQSKSSSRSLQKQMPEPDPDLEVGSMVEVMSDTPLYGLIRWIGNLPDQKEPKKLIAGLEMEEEISAGTDGTFSKHRLFTCPPKKAFFVPLYKCRKDKRFLDNLRRSRSVGSTNFGSIETPDVHGTISPPDSLESMNMICGKNKGIQGHHNSCYMDATLLSMFYFTTVFDSVLHRPLEQHEEVRSVLKEGIVNPLRKYHYVRADKVMKLRQLLDKLGNIKGMMNEEKDPEEFLSLLLSNITKAEPFLHISSSSNHTTHSYFYQMIMEKDERLVLPTTQQLFELSFLQMGIKLVEEPSCLIIQMPRFGKDYKMYRRIIPSLELDITDVLENAPRECIICGDLAFFECTECYQVHGAGLNTIAFCEGCKRMSHHHKQRQHHKPRKINVPEAFAHEKARVRADGGTLTIPRAKMELFAVICIQTSHYVSFVKCGKGLGAPWIFFDSMADRMGEQSGYNIPEVTPCEDLPSWLTQEKTSEIMRVEDDKALPEHMRRLVCDAYICMYQSPDVMMFK